LYWVNLATYQDTSPYLSLAIFVTHYTLIPSNPEEPLITRGKYVKILSKILQKYWQGESLMSIASSTSSIYEQDYVEWLDITLQQLQNRDLKSLDWEHLIEEIEDMGREQKHKVESYLLKLLIHLLVYDYWQTEKEWSGKGWEQEIDNFRLELDLLLESKVLYNHLSSVIDKIYQKARKNALRKSRLSPELLPQICPYSITQILDPEWLP
jgi:hypothetical protein